MKFGPFRLESADEVILGVTTSHVDDWMFDYNEYHHIDLEGEGSAWGNFFEDVEWDTVPDFILIVEELTSA